MFKFVSAMAPSAYTTEIERKGGGGGKRGGEEGGGKRGGRDRQ